LLFLFFVQDVTHIDRGYGPRIGIINVLSDGLPLAGFQVITYGRFWVITEDKPIESGQKRASKRSNEWRAFDVPERRTLSTSAEKLIIAVDANEESAS
jgi:hypothetical protein